MDVVALGELLIDFTENGISNQGNPILEANPGGAPCNVLAMLQKLGHQTAFIGKVGKDSLGDFLIEKVTSVGIDISNLLRDEEVRTTLAFVHTAPDGDRSFSFYRNPGADMMLKESEVNVELIKQARLFHFGTLSMSDDVVRVATFKALAVAKETGKLISFDPNYRPLLWRSPSLAKEMMAYGFVRCDILKIADDEIMFYTGKDSVEEACVAFRKLHQPKLMCVTLGKDGSIVYYEDKCLKAPGKVRNDTIETTGAGDTFMACVIHYVLEHGLVGLTDEQLAEMLNFANTAASIITTRRGALMVMPTLEEITKEL